MPDLYTAGASRVVNPDGTYTSPVCKMSLEVDAENGTREDMGEMPLMQALGLTALPAPPDDSGQAELVALEGVGGFTACAVGGRDTRCADVAGELAPGETCLHNTGGAAANRARVFCKDNHLSLLVGNDLTFILDRESESVSLAAFGHTIEVSKDNGILLGESGGAWFHLQDGEATLSAGGLNLAGAVSIGNATAQPVALATPITAYFTALEVLLAGLATAIDAKLAPSPGVSAGAVTAFIGSTAALKAQLVALFTKAT